MIGVVDAIFISILVAVFLAFVTAINLDEPSYARGYKRKARIFKYIWITWLTISLVFGFAVGFRNNKNSKKTQSNETKCPTCGHVERR